MVRTGMKDHAGNSSSVRSRRRDIGGQKIYLSASVGVADWHPDDRTDAEAVITAADRQLYAEKTGLESEGRRRKVRLT